jgi:hypothetical protein
MSPPPTRRRSLKSRGPSGAAADVDAARIAAHAASPDRCGRGGGAGAGEHESAVAAARAAEGEQSKERRERLEHRGRLPALLAELRLELGAAVDDAVSASDSRSSPAAAAGDAATSSIASPGGGVCCLSAARTAATIREVSRSLAEDGGE